VPGERDSNAASRDAGAREPGAGLQTGSEWEERSRRAAQALARAKEDARARGQRPPETSGMAPPSREPKGPGAPEAGGPSEAGGTSRASGTGRMRRRSRARREDPEPLAAAVDGLLSEQGWRPAVAAGAVFGRWDQIVGAELAAHTRPERFSDGELVVSADSTPWATQVRLLAATLVRRVNEELGNDMVKRVRVRGPAPPRRMGPLRVRGSRGANGDYG
jgi:predicted nucleic acid-binding Zn ribbon protein